MKTLKLPYSGLEAIQDDNPVAFPTLNVTENGVYNVRGYAYANVNVGGGGASIQNVGVIPAGDYVLQYNSEHDEYTLNAVQLNGVNIHNGYKVVYFNDGVNPTATQYGFTSGDYNVTIMPVVASIETAEWYARIIVTDDVAGDPSTITVTLPRDVQCYVASDDLIALFPNGRLLLTIE